MQEKNSTLFPEPFASFRTIEELQVAYERLQTAYEEQLMRNKALKVALEPIESIMETMDEPLVVLDGDLRICTANRSFYEQFHLSCGGVEDNYLEIGGGVFNIRQVKEFLQGAFAKESTFAGESVFSKEGIVSGEPVSRDFEDRVAVPGKGERIILFHSKPMNEDQEEAGNARLLVTMTDITERKILEYKKDEFISIASHELKTPATSIQAYTQILYYEFLETNDHKSAGLISKLNGQVSRLARLTKDLLDVTKIAEGQLRLKEEYFDMNALIDGVVEEMQLTTYQRIIVRQKQKQRLSCVWADKERMEQVLVNLIANAIKYSPQSEPVLVSSDAGEQELRLSVQDFGIGISPEIRDKVFDRFFRSSDPSALKHPGLGLGLYISYEIVRQHGGKITIESEKGQGAVFTIVLPIKNPGEQVG